MKLRRGQRSRREAAYEISLGNFFFIMKNYVSNKFRFWRCENSLLTCFRAANSHALTVRLTHFTTFSRSHGDIRISHAIFFFVCVFCFVLLVRGLWCTKGTPTMCLQNRGKNFEVEKKSVGFPPPRSSAFFGLARHYTYRLAADGPSHFSLQTLIQCWQPCCFVYFIKTHSQL